MKGRLPIDVEYQGLKFEEGFRADLLVENKVIIEIKCVERLNNAHKKQLLTYLRLADPPYARMPRARHNKGSQKATHKKK